MLRLIDLDDPSQLPRLRLRRLETSTCIPKSNTKIPSDRVLAFALKRNPALTHQRSNPNEVECASIKVSKMTKTMKQVFNRMLQNQIDFEKRKVGFPTEDAWKSYQPEKNKSSLILFIQKIKSKKHPKQTPQISTHSVTFLIFHITTLVNSIRHSAGSLSPPPDTM